MVLLSMKRNDEQCSAGSSNVRYPQSPTSRDRTVTEGRLLYLHAPNYLSTMATSSNVSGIAATITQKELETRAKRRHVSQPKAYAAGDQSDQKSHCRTSDDFITHGAINYTYDGKDEAIRGEDRF